MQKIFYLAGLIVAVSVFGCQAEPDPSILTGSPGQDSLLKSITSVQDTLTEVQSFNYNSSKQLLHQNLVLNGPSSSIYYNIKINRNSSGVITGLIIKSNDFVIPGGDSAISTLYFNSSINRYQSLVTHIVAPGNIQRDSAVFEYDAAGKLIRRSEYHKDNTNTGYDLYNKYEFSYTGSTLTSMKDYGFLLFSTGHLPSTTTYEYDDKVNPWRGSGIEAFLTWGEGSGFQVNNIIKETTVDPNPNGTGTTTVITSYTYNNVGKPHTSITTGNGAPITAVYTYQ